MGWRLLRHCPFLALNFFQIYGPKFDYQNSQRLRNQPQIAHFVCRVDVDSFDIYYAFQSTFFSSLQMLSAFNVAELAASSSSAPIESKVEGPVENQSPVQTPSPTGTDHSSSSTYFASIPLLLKREATEEEANNSDAELQPRPAKRRRKPDCKQILTLILLI